VQLFVKVVKMTHNKVKNLNKSSTLQIEQNRKGKSRTLYKWACKQGDSPLLPPPMMTFLSKAEKPRDWLIDCKERVIKLPAMLLLPFWTCQKGAGKPRNNNLRIWETSKQRRIREIQATCHVHPPIWTCQNGAWKTWQQQTREEMKADRETTNKQNTRSSRSRSSSRTISRLMIVTQVQGFLRVHIFHANTIAGAFEICVNRFLRKRWKPAKQIDQIASLKMELSMKFSISSPFSTWTNQNSTSKCNSSFFRKTQILWFHLHELLLYIICTCDLYIVKIY
jgi:hypothetical protein